MRIVVALNSLGIGGTESYALTVAEQLDRLAHEVVVYTPEPGLGVDLASERGIRVHGSGQLPFEPDVAFAQDAAVAFEMAELCPGAKRVAVAHSESFNPQSPPQLDGVVDAVVALNERVAARLRAFAADHRIVRLRQPIDTERYLPRGALSERPTRALLLSNNRPADREATLEAACAEVGLELTRLGGAGAQSTDPRSAIAAAQVVIGYGRAILEAMSCGRAAFVYDWAGGEGWVTADSYPRIEAEGIAGRDELVLGPEQLVEELGRYDHSMGLVNRDLIVAHHRANVHAQQLVALFEELGGAPSSPQGPLEEMARLVRLEWRARAEVHGLMTENADLHRRLRSTEQMLVRDVGLAQQETVRATQAVEASLSWRLTAPLRALGRLLRRLRPRS